MREIKFRAWDKDEKEMICGINECLMNWDGLQHNVDRFLNMQNHIPVMQYTGLKDKDGKEIYEGDIIFNDEWRGGCKGAVVEWRNGGFPIFCDRDFGEDSEEVEIIGNIYENPELLEGK